MNTSGTVTATQLYGPYGAVRYQSGTLPTDYGFTHQRADATSGLDYYGARYYDPVAGQFTSADTLLPSSVALPDSHQLNRYAYVGGNSETHTDPSGHCPWCIAGAIIGAVVGAGIVYGVQVYNNSQSGASNPWTSNIDWGAVGMGALAGAFIGGTMGAGATAAAGVLAAGGSAGTAASAGVGAAAVYAGYGIAPTAAGAELSDEEINASLGLEGNRPSRANPNAIRFTQAQGSNTSGGIYTVGGNIQSLESGALTPDDIAAIRVFRKEAYMDEWGAAKGPGWLSKYEGDPSNLENGQVYSLDNRRLAAFQRAKGVSSIPLQWMEDTDNGMQVVQNDRWKFSTTDAGRRIFIRGLD